MFCIRLRRHHVDPVPDLVEAIEPRPPSTADQGPDLVEVVADDLGGHRLGASPTAWGCRRRRLGLGGPDAHASSSFRTLPPSTISIGRLPGAISSLSAMMPSWL